MQTAAEAQGREIATAYGAYGEALRKAGAIASRAAVQSAHAVRRRTGRADWPAIEQL